MKIDYELKDRILKDLVESNKIIFTVDTDVIGEMAARYGIDIDTLDVILDDFAESGFLEEAKEPTAIGQITIRLKVPAYDFVAHGGFFAQEELFKKNIEKLILEIESLKPSMPDRVETITAIASNIATFLGLVLTHKP